MEQTCKHRKLMAMDCTELQNNPTGNFIAIGCCFDTSLSTETDDTESLFAIHSQITNSQCSTVAYGDETNCESSHMTGMGYIYT